MRFHINLMVVLVAFVAAQSFAASSSIALEPTPKTNVATTVSLDLPKRHPNPPATFKNVAYGQDPRQVLEFWKAHSDQPTPLVFYMPGGGWVKDDGSSPQVEKYLAAGISVVLIHYRFSWQAQLAGVKPPLAWPMQDAARALQFVRSKAADWNIDKKRIGVSGQSAGACTCLWLAFHKDMADPKSSDPIARESTRPCCAAVYIAQTSLDPKQMKEWTPNSVYGGGAFGFMDPNDLSTRDKHFDEFLQHRDELLPWIKEYSPMALVSTNEPPVYLLYYSPPAVGQRQKSPTHTANFGVKLQEKLLSVGNECELVYPGAPNIKHASMADFLVEQLKQ